MQNILFKKTNLILLYVFVFFLLLIFAINLISFESNETISIILGLAVVYFISLSLKWPNHHMIIFIGLTWFFVVKSINLFYLDPLSEPDALGYFQQTITFNSLWDYLQYAFDNLWTSSYVMFGLIYMPFYFLFGIEGPGFIVVMNAIFVILFIYMWMIISHKHLNLKPNSFVSNMLFIFLTTSSSLSYFSSLLGKDITNLFLITLALYLFLEKKYVFSILVSILAFSFRPYAIVIIGLYYLFIKGKKKVLLLLLLASEIFVYYTVGFVGVINSVTNMGYLLFSPNPFDKSNWGTHFFPTLESLVIFLIAVIVALKFVTDKNKRYFITTLIIALLIYSCVLTTVGYTSLSSRGIDYSMFSGGDNFFRKRLPMILIIYTSFCYLFIKNKTKRDL